MLKELAIFCILTLTVHASAWADDKPKIIDCYERSYDAAHMKRHPRQQVRWLQIVQYQYADEGISAEIRARFRGDRKRYADSGMCEKLSNGIWRCGVDCDGGRFTLDTSKTGRVDVRPLDWGVRVSVCGGDDEGEDQYRVIDPKQDQALFVLQQVKNPAKACKLDW